MMKSVKKKSAKKKENAGKMKKAGKDLIVKIENVNKGGINPD